MCPYNVTPEEVVNTLFTSSHAEHVATEEYLAFAEAWLDVAHS